MPETVLVYTYRIFWALFLSFMLIWGFRCSWKAENIKDYSGIREDTAVISLDPALFPMLLALCTFLYLILWREKGAVYLLAMITDIFLFICIYFTLLILFLPVLRKHYTARTCVALWLIPMLLYYQPNIMFISAPPSCGRDPVYSRGDPQNMFQCLDCRLRDYSGCADNFTYSFCQ